MVAKARKMSETTNMTALKAMYLTTVVANAFLEGMRLIVRRLGRYLCDIFCPVLRPARRFRKFLSQKVET
jgi:hypothetical protein